MNLYHLRYIRSNQHRNHSFVVRWAGRQKAFHNRYNFAEIFKGGVHLYGNPQIQGTIHPVENGLNVVLPIDVVLKLQCCRLLSKAENNQTGNNRREKKAESEWLLVRSNNLQRTKENVLRRSSLGLTMTILVLYSDCLVWDLTVNVYSRILSYRDCLVWDLTVNVYFGTVSYRDCLVWDLTVNVYSGTLYYRDCLVWDLTVNVYSGTLSYRDCLVWDLILRDCLVWDLILPWLSSLGPYLTVTV